MLYFQDSDDGYYEFADDAPPEWYAHLTPAAQQVPPVVVQTPAQQLAQLDADNPLTQRNLRETVMLMAEAFKTLSSGALDLSTIPGVAKVYEVEAQAAALRAQL